MALKKGILDSYLKEREAPKQPPHQTRSKYSHNRVFDEPESLKKILEDPIGQNEHATDSVDKALPIYDNETVSNGFKSDRHIIQNTEQPSESLENASNVVSSTDHSMFHEEHLNSSAPLSTVSEPNSTSNGFNRSQTVSTGFKSDRHIIHNKEQPLEPLDNANSVMSSTDSAIFHEEHLNSSAPLLTVSEPNSTSNGFNRSQTVSNGFNAIEDTESAQTNARNHDQNSLVRSQITARKTVDDDSSALQTTSNKQSSYGSLDSHTVSIGFNTLQTDSDQLDSTDNKKIKLKKYVANSNGFNGSQTVSSETVSKGSNRSQTVSDETVSNAFKGFQTVAETVSKRPSLSELKILYYFQENRDENGTFAIQRNQIAKAVNLKLAGVKTALIRLKTKGYIVLNTSSRGRYTGYTSYTLTPLAHQFLASPDTLDLLGFKRLQTVAETVSNAAISSSNINNNTTTSLPDEWKKINFVQLEHIGFSETQLCQLYHNNMTTPDTVQDAINRFAYSLEHNDKAKAYNDPLNVFMGVLRKGQRWVEPNYIPPKELAMRQMLEEKRKQKAQRDAMLNELIELEFPEWRRKLTDEEIKDIVPDDIRKTNIKAAINATLRMYFIENVLLPRLELQHE